LARPSTAAARAASRAAGPVEQCWVLVGERRGRIWLGRKVQRQMGRRIEVRFDGLWVLDREETRGDVIGFFAHPPRWAGPVQPTRCSHHARLVQRVRQAALVLD
jgi:hypothetical protein